MDADLRLLRYFVAVAEELHFTRAAARLHIAQQPLSAAIRRFEGELGVELLRRTTRRVELTDAGRALLEPARAALLAADDAIAAARAAGRGIAEDLSFGLSSGARYGLEPVFAAIAEQHPALHLHTHHSSAAPLIEDIRQGRLELAVTFGAHIPDDLEHERLKDEPAVLAVAATHPLADRETVALAELRDETFALDVPGANPDYDRAVVEACRRSGFEPRTRVSSVFHDAWEGAVHAEGCVGLTVRTAVHATHRDVRLLKLEQPVMFPIDLIWRDVGGTLRPALAAVLTTALEVRDQKEWRERRSGTPAPAR